MLKPCLTYLLAILIPILLSDKAFAQGDENWIFKSAYSGRYFGSPYNIRRDYFAKSESGRFNIQSAADVELIVKMKLEDEVIAVELAGISTADLPIVFTNLSLFPKLAYIRLLGKSTLNQNEKFNQLVANIHNLPQLKGVEFAYTDKIDMDDALKKLIPLKQLRILSFTEYKHQLPASITSLTQIDSVKLNTINIGDNDLSGVNWQKACIVGDPSSWADLSGVIAKKQERSLLRLSRVSSLKHLDLYADLQYPEIITKFTQIEGLGIEYENYKQPTAPFLAAVGSLKELQALSLSLVSDFPIAINVLGNLTELRSLSLNMNDHPVNQLALLGKFKNLEYLELAHCKIGILPDVFTNIPLLKKAILHGNEIYKVPVSLFNAPNLEYLDLAFNQITTIPNISSYACTKLKKLNLRENQLAILPQAIVGLPLLESVDCSVNHINSAPTGWEYLKNLKEVNLARNQLTEFPEGLQNNHSVEDITIFFNKIEVMRDVTGDDYRLKYLGIIGNPLINLPEHIGKYTELEVMEASNIKLQELPESLGNCKKLKTLLLGRSIAARTSLPAGLKDAKDLEVLYLEENPLLDHQSIFDVILALPRKSFTVNLSDDNISELPATKKWLTIPFVSLNLKNNPINELPSDFTNSKVITNVNLQGTNLQNKKAPSN